MTVIIIFGFTFVGGIAGFVAGFLYALHLDREACIKAAEKDDGRPFGMSPDVYSLVKPGLDSWREECRKAASMEAK